MNNKGFTLIEILAVIVIVSIISVVGVYAYSRYLDSAREEAYDTMAKSAANAASEYIMDHPEIEEVTLEELNEADYLEYPHDPKDEGKACTGIVNITNISSDDALDSEEYEVIICCANYSYKYNFPGGTKEKSNDSCPIE